MICVFVRNKDTIQVVDFLLDRRKPGESFAFAKPGVNKEAGVLGLEQGDVAGAAGRQYGNAQTDQSPQSAIPEKTKRLQDDGRAFRLRQ
jgi:hypothetical protein